MWVVVAYIRFGVWLWIYFVWLLIRILFVGGWVGCLFWFAVALVVFVCPYFVALFLVVGLGSDVG